MTPHFVAQVLECDGRIVVVFGGTASFRDWQENLTQLRGITPPQFKLASRLVNAIARSTDLPIHMIGHSEGGGEVQYCYLKNFASLGARLTGSTFNSQRLSAHLLERMDDDETVVEEADERFPGVSADGLAPWAGQCRIRGGYGT